MGARRSTKKISRFREILSWDYVLFERATVLSCKEMAFPIKVCVVCGEEFELMPGKPGFANRCPTCSEPEEAPGAKDVTESAAFRGDSEANAERRRVMRDMLYRKDS